MADPEEFAAHYCSAYPRLHLIAVAITGDRALAEDVVQEAAMIAVQKLDGFAAGSSFAAWLAEIVRRCALNHRRKSCSRKTFAADPAHLARLPQQPDLSQGAWPISVETGELLDDQAAFDDEVLGALNSLGTEARCCLLLRTVQKLTYREISDLMQIPEGTAMSHVHRSKGALREQLSSHHSPCGQPSTSKK